MIAFMIALALVEQPLEVSYQGNCSGNVIRSDGTEAKKVVALSIGRGYMQYKGDLTLPCNNAHACPVVYIRDEASIPVHHVEGSDIYRSWSFNLTTHALTDSAEGVHSGFRYIAKCE